MNDELYPIIFKRKSFHLFRNVGNEKIKEEELLDIYKAYESFESLYPDIKTKIRIVPSNKVNFKRDAEYCILLYSEEKDNYLMNMGYIGEQLDLYLVSKNIGSLWYGIGRPDIDNYDGLSYVIMIAIHKVSDLSMYRKDMYKAKRKAIDEIWKGEIMDLSNIVRFSPSACNSQPWFVENSDKCLTVYRYKKEGKRGIMPAKAVAYYNRIDIGIFLCVLEICMAHDNMKIERNLFIDDKDIEYSKVAEYKLG